LFGSAFLKTGVCIAVLIALCGCDEPPVPPEVQQAESQQVELWRAGASVYVPGDYAAYLQAYEASRDLLRTEQGRWVVLRDYETVRSCYQQLLEQGHRLHGRCEALKDSERQAATARLDRLAQLHLLLRETAGMLKDGRLAGERLAIAEVELDEARRLIVNDQWRDAESPLARAESQLAEKIRRLRPILGRYADPVQIGSWQQQAQTAIAASRTGRGQLLIISKLEKQLIVYRGGVVKERYPVTFGYNYLSRKLYAGDRATPEGSYRVVSKNPGSRYYRALVLDYPGTEDRRRFKTARNSGQIPPGAGIGSLIEIHGGGLNGLTNGCVALDNRDMQQLFELVDPGTPVVIVGTLVRDNPLARVLSALP